MGAGQESRNKTKQTLVDTLNRDLLRKPERVATLQRSIQRMEAIPVSSSRLLPPPPVPHSAGRQGQGLQELVAWRSSIPQLNYSLDEAERDACFKRGFGIAVRHLLLNEQTEGLPTAKDISEDQMRAIVPPQSPQITYPLEYPT